MYYYCSSYCNCTAVTTNNNSNALGREREIKARKDNWRTQLLTWRSMPSSLLSSEQLLLVNSPIYTPGMTSGEEHPFGQFRSPLSAMLLARFLCNHHWQFLTQVEQSSAAAKPAVCCQDHFHTESKLQHCPCYKAENCISWNQDIGHSLDTSEEMLFSVRHLWTLQGQGSLGNVVIRNQL